jgi:hypothetical protein
MTNPFQAGERTVLENGRRKRLHKMRHDIGEEHSGKETCDVVSPLQGDFSFRVRRGARFG